MYISPGLRGGKRLADGSLLTVTAILVRIQANGRAGILFCCVSTFLYHEFFSRAARGKSACRRLSTCGCGNFDSYTSVTGGWGFCFGMCQQFYTMYISPGLREGNLFVGDSLLTVAAVLVCIQAEREGGDFVLVCFNN